MGYATRSSIVLLLSFAGMVALAQGLSGKWSAATKAQNGVPLTVELRLAGETGTWRTTSQGNGAGRGNPCNGRELPVRVVSQAEAEMIIEVTGSKVLAGCMDEQATLKVLDSSSVEVSLKDGRVLKFTK